MVQSEVTEKVTTVVSQLGGPIVAPQDIAWALDMPAGRELLQFLADQMQGTGMAHLTTEKGVNDRARGDGAALRGIALESDELKSWVLCLKSLTILLIFGAFVTSCRWNRIKGQKEVASYDTIATPIGYATPSQLRYATFTDDFGDPVDLYPQ